MSTFLTNGIETSEKSVAGIVDSGRKFVVLSFIPKEDTSEAFSCSLPIQL